jgi:predicted secreted protein
LRQKANAQQRVLQYRGRSNTHQHWFAIGLQLGQKFFNVAFCSYLHHQFSIGQRFRAEGIQIPHLHKAQPLVAILKDILIVKKKRKILLFTIPFLLTASGVFYFFYPSHKYKASENDKFTIKIGESFDVRLYENGSTGYMNCWLNENKCNSIKLRSRQYENSLNQKLGYIGSDGTIKFTFIGTKVGIDTIKLSNCPTAVEHKSCDDFSENSTKSDNEFIITVIK